MMQLSSASRHCQFCVVNVAAMPSVSLLIRLSMLRRCRASPSSYACQCCGTCRSSHRLKWRRERRSSSTAASASQAPASRCLISGAHQPSASQAPVSRCLISGAHQPQRVHRRPHKVQHQARNGAVAADLAKVRSHAALHAAQLMHKPLFSPFCCFFAHPQHEQV